MARAESDVGRVFGHLRVVSHAPPNERGDRRYVCVCESSIHLEPIEHVVARHHLIAGRIRSCGCLIGKNVSRTEWFWFNVKKAGVDDCWLWTGGTNKHGYGHMTREDGSRTKAHIFSYELHKRPTGGLDVCHTCDNPSCVNPAHFFLGDQAANNRDCVEKRRHAFGERHAKSKLSKQDVRKIFESSDSCVSLAERYGVAASTISRIQTGKSWTIDTGVADGTQSRKGHRHLSPDQVRQIRKMTATHSDCATGRILGIGRTRVRSVRVGLTYTEVSDGG